MTGSAAAGGHGRRRGFPLVAASFVLALAASAFALFAPTGQWEDSTGASGTTSLWGDIRDGEEDRHLLWLVFLPTAVALAALVLESTGLRRVGRGVAALLLLAFALVTGLSVGLFFLPAVLAMIAAAVVPPHRPAEPAP